MRSLHIWLQESQSPEEILWWADSRVALGAWQGLCGAPGTGGFGADPTQGTLWVAKFSVAVPSPPFL